MGRGSRFGLVDVFFAGGPNGRGKLFVRVCSRGLAPAEHCSRLRGLATQWEAREVRGPCGGLLNYPQGFTQGGLHIVDYTATLAQRMRRSTPTSFHVRSWCSPAAVSAPTVEP